MQGRGFVVSAHVFSRVAICIAPLLLAQAHADAIAVSAAGSLRDALRVVNLAYEERNHERISVVYGPSLRLAHDIEKGAVPDVFISADTASVAYLKSHNLVRADRLISLVRNKLVLIAPRHRPAVPAGWANLAAYRSIVLADPALTPAGKLGQASLAALGMWKALADKITIVPSARGVLERIAAVQDDAGIVYRSVAFNDARVKIVDEFPEGSYAPIVYTIALTNAGKGPAEVSAYVNFVRSEVSLDIFQRYGFER